MGSHESKPCPYKLLEIEEIVEIGKQNGSFHSLYPLKKYVVKGKDIQSALSKLRKICFMNNIPLPSQISDNYCCGTISIVETNTNEIKKRTNPVWFKMENGEVVLTVYY